MIAICEVFAQASNEKTCRLPIATKALDFLVLKMLATNPRYKQKEVLLVFLS